MSKPQFLIKLKASSYLTQALNLKIKIDKGREVDFFPVPYTPLPSLTGLCFLALPLMGSWRRVLRKRKNCCQELWMVWDFTIIEIIRLDYHNFMDVGGRHETSRPETKDFIAYWTAISMSLTFAWVSSNFQFPKEWRRVDAAHREGL